MGKERSRNYDETMANVSIHNVNSSSLSLQLLFNTHHLSTQSQKEAENKKRKQDITHHTGISPSGFIGWSGHPEYNPHLDYPNDLLHNIRLGFISYALKGTMENLSKEDIRSLRSWLNSNTFFVFYSPNFNNKTSTFSTSLFWICG